MTKIQSKFLISSKGPKGLWKGQMAALSKIRYLKNVNKSVKVAKNLTCWKKINLKMALFVKYLVSSNFFIGHSTLELLK